MPLITISPPTLTLFTPEVLFGDVEALGVPGVEHPLTQTAKKIITPNINTIFRMSSGLLLNRNLFNLFFHHLTVAEVFDVD